MTVLVQGVFAADMSDLRTPCKTGKGDITEQEKGTLLIVQEYQ